MLEDDTFPVSQDMIRAGLEVFSGYDRDQGCMAEGVAKIYIAMRWEAVRQQMSNSISNCLLD